MSLALNPYQQYKQNAVRGASPGDLTMMLYDGLVRFLKLAMASINQNELEGAHDTLIRSQEIIAYLDDTLDPQYDLSQNLALLYGYMQRRLVEANTKKDGQIVSEVLEIAEGIRDIWQQALKLVKEQS